MILVDALYINTSGGLVLLKRLISEIRKKDIDVFYLFDKRIENIMIDHGSENFVYMKASMLKRFIFYKRSSNQFESIMCFGNIPPPIKMSCPVFVLFHNVLFFNKSIETNLIGTILFNLKKLFILKTKKNADKWFVQTNLVKNNLSNFLDISDVNIFVEPFYDVPSVLESDIERESNSFIYVGLDSQHKNHKRLLDAWSELLNKKLNYTLHLTIPFDNKILIGLIDRLNEKGAKIINHGYIDRVSVFKLYQKSEYLIHPSLEESFGLGIIEAFEMGCKIIVPNLPYVYELIYPDVTFNPKDVNSIVDSVQLAIEYNSIGTKLKVKDNTNKIVDTICLKTKFY